MTDLVKVDELIASFRQDHLFIFWVIFLDRVCQIIVEKNYFITF
uniref:Uncharacterized protein n=1 Tax=Arundo donax TaxID=35708 RepID=A0A0A8Z601_ARUDO